MIIYSLKISQIPPTNSFSLREVRVQFPERPGALVDFLDKLSDKFNITLFHYRNQGSAYGRVLVGFESKGSNYPKLLKYLSGTGFRFWDETQNSAYRAFLK